MPSDRRIRPDASRFMPALRPLLCNISPGLQSGKITMQVKQRFVLSAGRRTAEDGLEPSVYSVCITHAFRNAGNTCPQSRPQSPARHFFMRHLQKKPPASGEKTGSLNRRYGDKPQALAFIRRLWASALVFLVCEHIV